MTCEPGAKASVWENWLCVKPATAPNIGSFSTPIALLGNARVTTCCVDVVATGLGAGIAVEVTTGDAVTLVAGGVAEPPVLPLHPPMRATPATARQINAADFFIVHAAYGAQFKKV
jgi:hypothetical protein